VERAHGSCQDELGGLDLAHRVEFLVQPKNGLINQAITELRMARNTDLPLQLTLGDLLLRTGRAKEAMDVYQALSGSVNNNVLPPDAIELRLALCTQVSGELEGAVKQLGSLHARGKNPAVAYYLARALEELGRYDAARLVIADVQNPDADLSPLLNRLRQRL
jgi:predicted Zn-dependent protease